MTKGVASKPRKRATIPAAGARVHLKTVVSATRIGKRVRELSRQINRDYAGKSLLVVGVLEDCFVFMADLVRALTMPVVCCFIRPQVRDSDSGPVAMREIMYLPQVEAAGRNLLLVEGILDSGITLDHLCRTLLTQGPASLRTAALVDRIEDRKVDVPLDYTGFQLSGPFLVGYGLGYQQQYRNLPFLARLIP